MKIMKKLMLILVFVLGTVTMVNANSSVVLDDGCPGVCVRSVKAGALAFADPDGHDLMQLYKSFYSSCYDANC